MAFTTNKNIVNIIKRGQHFVMDPHFLDYFSGVQAVVSRAGFNVVSRVVDADEEEEIYRSFVASGNASGFLLSSLRESDYRVPLLQELGVPFVAHGFSTGVASSFDFLDVDNERAFYELTKHLLSLGHQKIGLLNGYNFMNFAIERQNGYARALEEAGLAFDTGIVFNSDMTEAYGYSLGRMMLDFPAEARPTAIVSSSVLVAKGVELAYMDAGLSVPKDVSIATYNDLLTFLINDEKAPFFTAARSSIREAGKAVANRLLELIEDPNQSPKQIIWQPEIVVGKSTQAI